MKAGFFACLLVASSAMAQETEKAAPAPREAAAPVITHHEITINGAPLRYTATTGMLPIRNATGVVEGNIFYVYYAKDGANPATRPLSFIFNGGPGSSTVWLHMGAFGPKKVHLNADGTNPPPPYNFEDNPYTLLDQSDLVFLDPVGTGYSRATKPEFGANFWGLDEDVRSVGEFVRLFLTKNQRWGSPKYLAGESYGTTRAAHLSGWLADNGIALNGVALISTVLNFQTIRQAHGNDQAWLGYFPTYTAAAWYHKKLPADLQAQPLEQVLKQSERWVDSTYLWALNAGDRMSPAVRQQVVAQMARFSGLSPSFIEENDLRITLGAFNDELLRDRRLRVGRLDERFTSFVSDPGNDNSGFDPSEASIRNSFTPILNDYMRRELNYSNDDPYYILGGGIGPWRWQQGGQPAYPDVTPSLERAFAKNPAMRLYVGLAYYDGATAYWAVEYTLAHLRISPEAKRNITKDYFQAGHMMYIEDASMQKLRKGLRDFLK